MDCRSLHIEVPHPKLGTIIARRPSPFDKPKVEEFLKRMSEESIYHRFFRLIKDFGEIIDKMLGGKDTLFCIAIEYKGSIIGCSEVYKTTWPDVGEPAVAVLDDFQGVGLGRLLVNLAGYCALQYGIKKFRAYVFKDNVPALRLTKYLSPRIIDDLGDSYLIEMDLEAARDKMVETLSSYNIRLP
ncbi:MAG: GNAT family N-acetyltransferase [Desulfurococcales archaeon]|nr:GNAT family N-acetyltransferase [Desulfurococcales archaeon]